MKVRYNNGTTMSIKKKIIELRKWESKLVYIVEIIDFEDVETVYLEDCQPDLVLPNELGKNMTNLAFMFQKSPFNGDISRWDVSNVISMQGMFYKSKFNGDISRWDVSNVTDMQGMFSNSQFNGDISNWDVSSVKRMSCMFDSSMFNGDISFWDVSNVRDMDYMFDRSMFNGDISNWDVSNVRNMNYMFYNINYCHVLYWDVTKVESMFNIFEYRKSYIPIKYWEISLALIKKEISEYSSKKRFFSFSGELIKPLSPSLFRKKNPYFKMCCDFYLFLNLNIIKIDDDQLFFLNMDDLKIKTRKTLSYLFHFLMKQLHNPNLKDLSEIEFRYLQAYDIKYGDLIGSTMELIQNISILNEEVIKETIISIFISLDDVISVTEQTIREERKRKQELINDVSGSKKEKMIFPSETKYEKECNKLFSEKIKGNLSLIRERIDRDY